MPLPPLHACLACYRITWAITLNDAKYSKIEIVDELVRIIIIPMFHYTEFPYSIMSISYSGMCVCV